MLLHREMRSCLELMVYIQVTRSGTNHETVLGVSLGGDGTLDRVTL